MSDWKQGREARQSAYAKKLKDPKWQKMRLEILNRDEWRCQYCFDDTSTLHVHHLYYEGGKEPWDYPPNALVTLCEDCHDSETEDRPAAEKSLLMQLRKKGFSSSGVWSFSSMFYRLPMIIHEHDVIAHALDDALSDPDFVRAIVERYLADVSPAAREQEAEQGENEQ